MNDDLPADVSDLAERLVAERPRPAPGFRGKLRRQLVAQEAPSRLPARRPRSHPHRLSSRDGCPAGRGP